MLGVYGSYRLESEMIPKTLLREWTSPYRQMGKHRKKCRTCHKLIQDGELTYFRQVESDEYYPRKGVMKFTSIHTYHKECEHHEGQ